MGWQWAVNCLPPSCFSRLPNPLLVLWEQMINDASSSINNTVSNCGGRTEGSSGRVNLFLLLVSVRTEQDRWVSRSPFCPPCRATDYPNSAGIFTRTTPAWNASMHNILNSAYKTWLFKMYVKEYSFLFYSLRVCLSILLASLFYLIHFLLKVCCEGKNDCSWYPNKRTPEVIFPIGERTSDCRDQLNTWLKLGDFWQRGGAESAQFSFCLLDEILTAQS